MASYSSVRGLHALRQLTSLLKYKLANKDVFAGLKYRGFLKIREKLETLFGASLAGKNLLEIGCGQWQSNVKLFSALDCKIVGVDPEVPPSTFFGYPRYFLECGAQRAVKTAANELIFRRRFDGELQKLAGLTFNRLNQSVLRVGGERVPLDDGSIDAVFSDNVFEHLPDVESVISEVWRVLRPGGVAFLITHPFAAYSGGHHPATYRHSSEAVFQCEVPPWDHLRGNHYPSGVYCNGLRASEYRTIFERHLSTFEWETVGPEGEEFLTQEILDELPEYSREELLTGKLLYVGRKE